MAAGWDRGATGPVTGDVFLVLRRPAIPSTLSTSWALNPNSTGIPRRPFRMGRASGSCNDTTRVAPSGTPPARRTRVWAIPYSMSPAVRSNSATRAVTLERGRATLLSLVVERKRGDLRRLRGREGSELVERCWRTYAHLKRDGPRELQAKKLRPTLAEMRAVREDFGAVVAEIQREPCFSDAFRLAEISDLRTAAIDGPLVYMVVRFGGGLA